MTCTSDVSLLFAGMTNHLLKLAAVRIVFATTVLVGPLRTMLNSAIELFPSSNCENKHGLEAFSMLQFVHVPVGSVDYQSVVDCICQFQIWHGKETGSHYSII